VKIRVLIADDHGMVAEGLRSLIEGQPDMEVVAMVDNGLDAVRVSRETLPDVVVMDNAMPLLNGIEAARNITRRTPGVRVVMLSMHADGAHVYRALQAGAKGYVVKKSVAKELMDAIRTVQAGRRYLSKPLDDQMLDRITSDVPEDPLARLSARERQVLQMIAEGKSVVDIAAILSLSRKTVETYRERMMEKLELDSLAALVKLAVQQGITPLGE
jgi:DNA-binding NarL/FixJ family response regulator